MKDDLTEIFCIIDRSGSMAKIRTDAIGGFNSFLEEQKKVPGQANITLVLFDQEYLMVHNNVDIRCVTPLDETTYIPRGMTALLDAVGRTIDQAGIRLLNTPENLRPKKVIVTILTDGLENASERYTLKRVSEMIQHQQSHYGWEFVFLAANQDAIATAVSMSINQNDAFAFRATEDGIREGYAQMSTVTMRKRMG